MSQSQLSLPLTKDQAYALVDAVMERDDLALSASAHEGENEEWIFQATCDTPPDVDAFNQLAREVLGGAVEFAVEPLDADMDWVSKSLEGLKPVQAGGFYVFGTHDAGNVPEGLTPIHIDAAQAFGTGHHETTTGCLEAIETVLNARARKAMLDVGTGTGILAIALAKCTGLPIIATDIDPIAVQITEENARLNGVANQIIAAEATGLDAEIIAQHGPYDLIVANILAGPLTELAPAMSIAASTGAAIVLSGILGTQADGVIAAYDKAGMGLTEKIVKNEWVALIMEKR